ncbi:hypothetical protein BGZ94_002387 [Podila epigama]|nr:hypothetical protein BGZ94_002387 [Podila epigama]
MDDLLFPSPGPTPLIVPRRPSLHGGHRHGKNGGSQQGSYTPESPPGSDNSTQYYYPPSNNHQGNSFANSIQPNDPQGNGRLVRAHTRRHSVATGSPMTALATTPRHALHMPVMKFNPEIWRKENHEREVHRLMHEGREEEVMKRRDMRNVMDTSDDEHDDDRDMLDVESTIDLGGFKEAEEREKERIQEEVRREWQQRIELLSATTQNQFGIDTSLLAQRRRSWPNLLQQQPIMYGQQQFDNPFQGQGYTNANINPPVSFQPTATFGVQGGGGFGPQQFQQPTLQQQQQQQQHRVSFSGIPTNSSPFGGSVEGTSYLSSFTEHRG